MPPMPTLHSRYRRLFLFCQGWHTLHSRHTRHLLFVQAGTLFLIFGFCCKQRVDLIHGHALRFSLCFLPSFYLHNNFHLLVVQVLCLFLLTSLNLAKILYLSLVQLLCCCSLLLAASPRLAFAHEPRSHAMLLSGLGAVCLLARLLLLGYLHHHHLIPHSVGSPSA